MAGQTRPRRWLAYGAQVVALGAAYAASAKLALAVAPECPWATLFWPPCGVGLAALVMGGTRLCPAITLSMLVVSSWILGRPPLVAAGIALNHTVACLAGALVLQRVPGFHRSLERLRDVLAALVLAGAVTSLLDAAGGATAVTLGGIARGDLSRTFAGWLAGAFVGIFVIAPAVMTWLSRLPVPAPTAVLAEAVTLGASVLVFAALVFAQEPSEAVEDPLFQPYVLIFPLIWAAVRFGVRGASAASLAVAFVTAFGTYTGHGPFVRPDRLDSLDALHVYLASTSFASLALGAVAFERVRTACELAAVVECSSDAIVVKGMDERITSWNAAATRLYGYAPEEAIGRPISMLFPPEVREESERMLAQLARGAPVEAHETVRLCKDGRRIEVSVAWSPIRDRTGAMVGASAIVRDMGESAERWRLAAEAARLGMWFWKVKEDRLTWTPVCRSLFGLGPDEDLSRARWLALVHPDDRARVDEAVARSVATRDRYRVEYRNVWPDGSVHWISALGRFYGGQRDADARVVGVVLDITARKRAEQERDELLERERAALAEARAATRAKDEFLAVVSHELRTPLQVVLGWTAMLRARRGEAVFLEKGLAAIEANATKQAQLVEDLLDVSRIAAGKLRIERVRVDLAGVVEAVLDATRVAVEAKAICLDAAIDRDVGAVMGDPVRLEQVVSNLVTNAVKFTPSGGRVEVRLAREGATAELVVADTGRGISPEFLPHVFERFRQEGGVAGRQGGLGLGLAIVCHLVEEHAGTIRAESPGEGCGATFTVTLPLLSVPPSGT